MLTSARWLLVPSLPSLALLMLSACPGPEFAVGGGGQSSGTTTTTSGSTGGGGEGAGGAAGSGGAGTGGTMCTIPSDCAPVPCHVASCHDGECAWEPGPAGPTADQTEGDCKTQVCTQDGEVSSVPDNSDLPDDGDPCTDDLCDSGAPAHPQLPEGAPCGGGNLCSPTGDCVECLDVTQCLGNPCKTPAGCNAGVCEFTIEEAGTACGTLDQCDGLGDCVECVNSNGCLDTCPVDACVCTPQHTCVQP